MCFDSSCDSGKISFKVYIAQWLHYDGCIKNCIELSEGIYEMSKIGRVELGVQVVLLTTNHDYHLWLTKTQEEVIELTTIKLLTSANLGKSVV